MHASYRSSLPLALLLLAACSSKHDGKEAAAASAKPAAYSPIAEANAEFARLQAQGPDALPREVTKLEYPLTRSLMKAAGIVEVLGGEVKADAALDTLFASYEQKTQALRVELPKAFAPRNEGGGGSVGAESWGGAAASTGIGGIQNQMGEQAWENGQADGQASGSQSTQGNGTSVNVEWTPEGYTSTTTVEGAEMPGGLKGKVTTRVKALACPDPTGKVEIEFESISELGAGAASAQTKITSKLVKHLDDDANLLDADMDSDVNVQQSTGTGSHVDITDTLSTSRGEMGTTVNGRSSAASDENMQMAQGLAKLARLAAMNALEASKKAWESGKCVDLQVRSDPAKRKGARPNTAYTLFAEPRAKSDGAPTGGTVKATLNGANRLNPTGKVKADAKFDYANPEQKDQSASIDFEARSKRGVGKATLEFDTKRKSYSIEFAQCPGGGRESMRACDISKPFTLKACGGTATISHTPTGDKGGNWTFHFQGAGGFADSSGTYTLSGPDESMTARYVGGKVCGHAAGRTICAAPKPSSVTWTRIEDCAE